MYVYMCICGLFNDLYDGIRHNSVCAIAIDSLTLAHIRYIYISKREKKREEKTFHTKLLFLIHCHVKMSSRRKTCNGIANQPNVIQEV